MKFLSNKMFWYRMFLIIGILLFVSSIVLKSTYGEDVSRITSAGLGLGIVLIGFCSYMTSRLNAAQKNPELFRKQKIEQNDERNILIRDKALAKANVILTGLIFVALFVLSFFEVAWYIPVSLGVIIAVNILSSILYYVYYNKRL